MKRALLFLLTLSCLHAAEQPALCIEPVELRTEAAELLPGSRQTVLCPASADAALGLSRLNKVELAATGQTLAQFKAKALAAAAAHLKTLKPDLRRNAKGVAEYAILKSDSHLTASVVLCPEFYAQFRATFGDKLVVMMPDRFTVYVFARGFGDFQKLGPQIVEQYEKATWPCSREAFEITADGLKCLGEFEASGK
jgi:hypothetical protein